MRLRLFGVTLEIRMLFWITAAFLGMSAVSAARIADPVTGPAPGRGLAIWIGVALVAVLSHELGHALAVLRHGLAPAITLHGVGGTTSFREVVPLRRRDHVIIALAGPFASFVLGGTVAAALHFIPGLHDRLGPLGRFAVDSLRWVSLGWGLLNLVPVLPFDGGHVLTRALGPERARLAAGLSTAAAFLAAVGFVAAHRPWGALLFGLAAIQSYRQASGGPAPGWSANDNAPPAEGEDPGWIAPELGALLRRARHALATDDLARASSLAQQVIDGDGGTVAVTPQAVVEALEVLAWTHLLAGRAPLAAEVLEDARRIGPPDPALAGAVYLAAGDLVKAREVLEAARARGDLRKEVVGPLVQTLIAQGEIPRAAEAALSIVESLSDEDARTMARVAYDHRAFDGAARLWEAAFNRAKQPEDAYDAARAEAQSGHPERALALLRSAVAAGFTDRARAWSDAALEALRATPPFDGGSPGEPGSAPLRPQLEAVVPRP